MGFALLGWWLWSVWGTWWVPLPMLLILLGLWSVFDLFAEKLAHHEKRPKLWTANAVVALGMVFCPGPGI